MTSEDLPELKANPIFLQQFLQLTLPKILAVENEGSAQPITPSQKSTNPLLSQTASLPKLELWKDFRSSVKEALAKLPTIEGYQQSVYSLIGCSIFADTPTTMQERLKLLQLLQPFHYFLLILKIASPQHLTSACFQERRSTACDYATHSLLVADTPSLAAFKSSCE